MADFSSFINFRCIGLHIRLRREYRYILTEAYADDNNVIKIYESVKKIHDRPNILLNEKRPLLFQKNKFDFLFKLSRLIEEYIELYDKLDQTLLKDGGYHENDRHEFCTQEKGREVIWKSCMRNGILPGNIPTKAEEIVKLIRSEKQKKVSAD